MLVAYFTFLLSYAVLLILNIVNNAGGDSRFDQVKKDPAKFTIFWLALGMYYFCSIITRYINIISDNSQLNHGGLVVYFCNGGREYLAARGMCTNLALGLSFLFKVIADHQKSTWEKTKKTRNTTNNSSQSDCGVSVGIQSMVVSNYYS